MSDAKPKKEKQINPQQQGKKGGQPGQKGQQQQQGQKSKQSRAPAEDVKREQKLQAVVLADSFTKTFRPITFEAPKVLLPLVNEPMLDYTIEFLTQNGVEEIFIFCVSQAEKVEEYVRKSRWNDIVSIQCISSISCTSAGDALREIDALNVIRSDPFVLISGDVVSNMNIQKAIAYHKKKRQEDSSNIMTLTLKKVPKTCGVKPLACDLVVGMNKTTSQIIFFEDNIAKSKVSLPIPLVKNTEISLSTQYIDCHVDICSPELILQFSDNFDYRDIRQDFIHNEVTNFALGKHIYGYVLQQEYAARVVDARSYHAISRDLINRWVFPIVPDAQLFSSDQCYIQSHGHRHVYKDAGVKVSRFAKVTEEVVIGRGSTIGDHSSVHCSTLGKSVSVGKNVTIVDSHIWNNVTIGDAVDITGAIVCDGVTIGAGVKVPRGCILSYGVTVDATTPLTEFSRITMFDCSVSQTVATSQVWEADMSVSSSCPDQFDSDEESEDGPAQGKKDISRSVRMSSVGCVEEEAWKRALWTKFPLPQEEDESTVDEDDEDDDEAMGGGGGQYYDDEDSNSQEVTTTINRLKVSVPGDDNNGNSSKNAKSPKSPIPSNIRLSRGATPQIDVFQSHVVDLVSSAISERHPSSAILMEIKGLKFSHNRSFGECVRSTMAGVLSHLGSATSVKDAILKLKELVAEDSLSHPILTALKQNVNDELEIIAAVEDFILQPGKYSVFGTSLSFFLHSLYDEDLITEEGVLLWASHCQAQKEALEENGCSLSELDSQRLAMFQHPLMKNFLEMMEEDSEDEEEESDED